MQRIYVELGKNLARFKPWPCRSARDPQLNNPYFGEAAPSANFSASYPTYHGPGYVVVVFACPVLSSSSVFEGIVVELQCAGIQLFRRPDHFSLFAVMNPHVLHVSLQTLFPGY